MKRYWYPRDSDERSRLKSKWNVVYTRLCSDPIHPLPISIYSELYNMIAAISLYDCTYLQWNTLNKAHNNAMPVEVDWLGNRKSSTMESFHVGKLLSCRNPTQIKPTG